MIPSLCGGSVGDDPVLSVDHRTHQAFAHPHGFCDPVRTHAAPRRETNHPDLIIGILAHPMGFIDHSTISASAFAVHIGHVIGLSADPKMVRITASSCIAMVKNREAFWDRALRKLIGQSMSQRRPILPTHLSVPGVRMAVAFPKPTPRYRVLFRLGPKDLFGIDLSTPVSNPHDVHPSGVRRFLDDSIATVNRPGYYGVSP